MVKLKLHTDPPGWLVALVGVVALAGLAYNVPRAAEPEPQTYTLHCTSLTSQAGQPVIVFKFRSDTDVLFFERHFPEQVGELEHWEERCS